MSLDVEIDGIEYRPVETRGEELRICVVDNRGLTFVGFVNIYQDSEILTIRDARCIIRWGTTKHLAELVDGPVEDKTLLGAVADVEVLKANLIVSYKVRGVWGE